MFYTNHQIPAGIPQRIERCKAKLLVGKHVTTSYFHNRTPELWRSFMPRRNEIKNVVGTELYSLQVYPADFFDSFRPDCPFEKWALCEVTDLNKIPEGMESFEIPAGLYSVFSYKGPSTNHEIFEQLLGIWLPHSGYILDNRPHFEVLGEKYKNNHPDSEEEIWIPIKLHPTK